MFKKKRTPIEIPHEWNRELVDSFFKYARDLDSGRSVEQTIYISGIKRTINNEEITLKAYGLTTLPNKKYWPSYNSYIQALIEISFYKDCTTKPIHFGKASLNTYFCQEASQVRTEIENQRRKKEKLPKVPSIGFENDVAALDVQLILPSHFEKLLEENFLHHKLQGKMPSLIIRLKLPENFDAAKIDPAKAWEPKYEIERFWLDSVLAFNPNALAKSFLFRDEF